MDERDELPGVSEGGLALAHRRDFRLGNATIRPSIRTVDGRGGSATMEPRAMQVLLALVDADAAVLSRDDLLQLCWQGRIVGDDAVNRTIAAVRRIAAETHAGFGIETIPRIGYRLNVTEGDARVDADQASPADEAGDGQWLSRRRIIAGGVGLAGLAGLSGWWFVESRADAEYSAQLEKARDALLTQNDRIESVTVLRQLAAIHPDRAEVWGLLAYAQYNFAEVARPQQTNASVRASEEAAKRALAIDPQDGYALLAQAMLRSGLDDWVATERRLRHILEQDKRNIPALESLILLLQSVGRCKESRDLLDRAIALKPLLPSMQFKRALKFWIFGDVRKADLTIDRARQLWPRDEWVWNARLMIYAFTQRPLAALAMVQDKRERPATLSDVTAQLWRTALNALHTRSRADIAGARDLILQSAPKGPANAGNGVMLLSAMGELDAAFAVADSLLLKRGAYIDDPEVSDDARLINSQGWRRTQWMFTPATNSLRSDVRFSGLCSELGLADYWRRSGTWPDSFVRGSIEPARS